MKKKFILFSCVFSFLVLSFIPARSRTYTKEVNKKIEFPSNGDISVKTTNGKIDIVSWNREEIEIFAEIKVKDRSRREAEELLEEIEIIVDKAGDRVHIEADVPGHRGTGLLDWIFGGNNPPVVNFLIKVPRKSNLDLRSTNGRINVEDVEGENQFSTTNGAIVAESMRGSVDAHTTNGSIRAYVVEFGQHDAIRLKTTNGSLKLSLPPNVKGDLNAKTVNGSISTDFPLTVQGKFIGKRISGAINGGGGRIELKTVNGSIRIYE